MIIVMENLETQRNILGYVVFCFTLENFEGLFSLKTKII